ncbi:MAG: hypothetical protein GXO75_16585 [Calditrichaeota bacterium]|nr:hypothetical protein [Calditrichota bacterium]
MNQTHNNALTLFKAKKYQAALEQLAQLVREDMNNAEALIMQARCFLAIQDHDSALRSYNFIIKNANNFPLAALGEAELVSGRLNTALSHLELALRNNPRDGETAFLSAVAAYKSGFISNAYSYINRALMNQFSWEDDDPVDFILQHVLLRSEYTDFEHIFLDVEGEIKEGKSPGHNRWFAITLPIFWFYTAPPGEEQKQRAAHLFQLISGESMPDDGIDGHEQLKNILYDFASSQSDARFGLETLKYLQERNYEHVARLVLALQLEHLKEFAFCFRLHPETVTDSNMRELIPLLPLRIATILMFLYASSDPQDQIEKMAQQNIDKDFLTKLLTKCFISYYQEIDHFKKQTTNHH